MSEYDFSQPYQDVIRGLGAGFDAGILIPVIEKWEEYMQFMKLYGKDANREFMQIMAARVQSGCISIVAPSLKDLR